jgi:hypothetical protein
MANSIQLAEVRVHWLALVNMTINIWKPQKAEELAAEQLEDSQGLCSVELDSYQTSFGLYLFP